MRIIHAACLLAFVSACVEEEDEEELAGPRPEKPIPIDPTTVGDLMGVVTFAGTPPAPQTVSLTPECARFHDGPVMSNDALVKDGKVQNAFVYIKKGLERRRYPTPKEPVVLDQRGCIYEPRVIGAQVNQPVSFLSSDPVLHNVQSGGQANRTFNVSMPTKGSVEVRKFKKPEVMVRTKCDVHPWMRAFIGVLPHPHFAVTGPDGRYTFRGVPPGDYVIEAWHEVFGRVQRKVTLAPKGQAAIDLPLGTGESVEDAQDAAAAAAPTAREESALVGWFAEHPELREWLNLLLRWLHVFAAILWIGSTWYFAWLDKRVHEAEAAATGGDTRIWMVHSGGFYAVEKQKGVIVLPPELHWFRWEAAITWMSGMALLVLVYHLGGLLVDKDVYDLSLGMATLLGLGLIIVGWAVYDLLWMSPLGRNGYVGGALCYGLIAVISWGLHKVLSPRAAFIHLGALFGTLMVANVWMRILPAQRAMIAATKAGAPLDQRLGDRAKGRSTHNTFMVMPVVLIMLSNHFPTITFGTGTPWMTAMFLVALGWTVSAVLKKLR